MHTISVPRMKIILCTDRYILYDLLPLRGVSKAQKAFFRERLCVFDLADFTYYIFTYLENRNKNAHYGGFHLLGKYYLVIRWRGKRCYKSFIIFLSCDFFLLC